MTPGMLTGKLEGQEEWNWPLLNGKSAEKVGLEAWGIQVKSLFVGEYLKAVGCLRTVGVINM